MYKGIFQNSLPKIINEITPDIPYWETSPSMSSNRLDTIKSGDIHFWRVWGGGTPIEEYNKFVGRFNSEYGMQSMPDISTI
jgi:beta-mannosidase